MDNTNVEPEKEPSAPSPKPVSQAPPKVVKEAEHKLKEMSRKAKERKAHNASKGLSETNYFWLVIGGLGALGVGYLVFWKKDPEQKPRQRFKGQRPVAYASVPKTPEDKEPVIEKESLAAPKFELNCF